MAEPLSDHDRSAVELTARLLRADAKQYRAAVNSSREPRATLLAALLRERGAEACEALLADRAKAPPEPAVQPAGPST